VLANVTGSSLLAPRVLDGTTGGIALVLAMLGFGVKAGAVPMHVWLPEAHAVAPSHVSALMSGAMIKLGLYGILRTLTLVAPPPWAGPVLAALGVVSAVAGIALALYQRDLKRTFAYSSVENVGVMLLGIGLGLSGLATDHPMIAVFGLYGGLLHVWVHAVVKGALFLGAGNVVHATGTRDVEQLGGLLARMPRTGLVLIVGGVAIAALPPLAGFASEWLVYLGLVDGGMRGSGSGLVMLLGVTVLAGVGVLAALCFVRALGLALLGQPRSAAAAAAREVGVGELAPMAVLGIATVALPFAAPLLVPALAPVAEQLAGSPVPIDRAVAALATIAWVSAAVWAAIAVGAVALAYWVRRSTHEDTWGCGYAAPTARMQYTSGRFSEAAQKLLPRRLRARVAVPRDPALFPAPGQLTSDRRDPFTREGYEPGLDRLVRRLAGLRWVQQGILHTYLLLIVAAVIVLVAAVSLRDWWLR
jgi:hydrogenase-4 component B